jgi:outer membrane lipoprotein LolB
VNGLRPLLAVCACLLAAACTLNPPAPSAEPTARQAATAFALTGRLSATDGEHSATGKLEWQHQPTTERWTVLSPLGQIVARLDVDPTGATVTFANGERRYAPQASDLLPMLIPGVADAGLPPDRFADWVQAAPRADAEIRTRDAQGRPARAVDQGWIIDYLSYQSDAPAALPRLLDISRGEFRLRLVIDQWATP